MPGSQVFETSGELVAHRRVRARGAGQARRSRHRGASRERRRACARAWCSTTRRDTRSGPARTSTRAPATRPPSSSRPGEAQEIYDHAGDWVSITSPARFLWIARHEPELFSAIAHVGMLGDWVLTKLSGEFVTDAVARLELGHVRPRQARLVRPGARRSAGLTATIFPPIVESGTVIGAVTRQGRRGDRALRRGRRSSSAVPTPSSACSASASTTPDGFTVVGGSFWQTHDVPRQAARSTRRPGCARCATRRRASG